MQLRKAERKQAKIKLALQGSSGSGKTYSALLIAYGLVGDWNKICVIDTENNSADLYSDLGDYNVLPLTEPFTPEEYVKAIDICINAGMQVVIIDSTSHEWDGKGGILEAHSAMSGNSFANWAKITPRHNAFVQKMLQSPVHIIATIRTKQDYVLMEKNGRQIPEKVGLKGITREGLDYEFTLVFDIDIKHQASASKDRTRLFVDRPQFMISEETGQQIKKWCESGITIDKVREMVKSAKTFDELKGIARDYPEFAKTLESDRRNRAIEWVTELIEQAKSRDEIVQIMDEYPTLKEDLIPVAKKVADKLK